MPSYASNYTPRFRSKYTVCGITHTLMVRKVRDTTEANVRLAASTIHELFNNWAVLLSDDFSFISSDYALTDSDVFIPWTNPTPVTGLIDHTTYTPMQKITATTQSGRAPGSKSRFSLYGIFWDFTNIASADHDAFNGIVTGAENAAVLANQAQANGASLAAGSGVGALWYAQCTIKPNDYLWKLVRRGSIT